LAIAFGTLPSIGDRVNIPFDIGAIAAIAALRGGAVRAGALSARRLRSQLD